MTTPLKAEDHGLYREVLDAPEGVTVEILDGEVVMQARPVEIHEEVRRSLSEFLRPAFQRGRGGPGGWWIRDESEIHLGDPNYRTIVPDLAGWSKERVPTPPRTYFDIAPDWVCEVLSPSTARTDRLRKMPLYADVGVSHLWIVDPEARYLECFKLQDGLWVRLSAFGDQDEVAAPPFEGFSFGLGDLWLPDPPEEEGA